jgi:hypothetical protein
VRLSPLGTSATIGVLYQPQMIDDGNSGAIGEIKIGRRNRSTRRKPTPVSLCEPQILHDLSTDGPQHVKISESPTNLLLHGLMEDIKLSRFFWR